MIAKAARQLPPQMPAPPSYQKVNPADQPVLFLVAPLADAAALGGRRVRRVDDGAADLDGQRRGAGQVFGAAKYAVRIDVDPRKLAAHGIGIDEVATAITNANVNLPTGTMYGRARPYASRPTASCSAPAAYGPMIIAYRNGNPVRLERDRARLRRRRERQERRLVQRRARRIYLAVQKQPGTNVVEVVDAVKALLPTFREQLPASVVARRPHRPLDSDPRLGRRREVHAAADDRPGRRGHLPLPAQHLGDDHPQPGAAGVDRRHLRGDVPARLQPRQPVADGADAVGRLRRRRRDRDAREHRPPHGDGQDADAGGATTARRKSPSPSSR